MLDINRSTTATLTDERLVAPVELPDIPLEEDESDIYISEDGTRIGYLLHDTDPMEYEFPEGVEFVQGNNRYYYYNNDPTSWMEGQVESGSSVFLVGVYEHEGIEYSLAGTSLHSHDQWDYGINAAISISSDFTNPEEAAKSILEEYTNWCNGQVFIVATGEKKGELWEWDYCGGYIGYKYAIETIAEFTKEQSHD